MGKWLIMKENHNSISNIALTVKKIVDDTDKVTPDDIHIFTKMSNKEFFAAVGWLARDNDISKSKVWEKLGETKLTSTIGTNAGKVWKALVKHDKFDNSNLSTLTHLDEIDAYTALGWLARDNKIDLLKINDKKNDVIFKLGNNIYNIDMKDNPLWTDKKRELQLEFNEEDKKIISEMIVKNSAESLTRMFSDISIKGYKDTSEIEKIIDLKFKGFDS